MAQQRASLLLSCVHDIVLSGADHELSQWFPTAAENPRPIDDRIRPVFADFTSEYRRELSALIADRVVQTNEVGRSAPLRLALAHVSAVHSQPKISLIEVGAAAGLLLALDAYRIDFDGQEMAPSISSSLEAPSLSTGTASGHGSWVRL